MSVFKKSGDIRTSDPANLFETYFYCMCCVSKVLLLKLLLPEFKFKFTVT